MNFWSPNNSIRTPVTLLGLAELLVLFSSIYAGSALVYGSHEAFVAAHGLIWPKSIAVSIVNLTSLISMGLYSFRQRMDFRGVLLRLFVGFGFAGVVLMLISATLVITSIPYSVGAVAFLYSATLLVTIRYFFWRRADDNWFRRRVLIYGDGDRAKAIADLRRKADRRGFKIVGSIPAPGDNTENQYHGSQAHEESINQLANELDVEEIVIAMDNRRGNLPVRELLDCKLRGIGVVDLLEFLERETGKIRVDLVNPGWLIFGPGFQSGGFRDISKRSVDLAASTMLLALTFVIMLVVAIAIKCEDGIRAPVFYRQERVGHLGKLFSVFKFRSMAENAEADGKAVWADKGDPRITRVGVFIRKYRLDELPQIFNVLVGNMSLVGPRPERPEFVGELSQSIPYYAERHTVKPGVTGWAQLKYPYGSSEEDAVAKLQFDLYYVKNHNILLDLGILLQTAEVVLWGKGAR